MRTLAFTILTMGIALAAGQARAQTHHRQVESRSLAPAETAVPGSYCIRGRQWGYPGNCMFSSYAECMATASGTDAYCGIDLHYAFALQRRGDYRARR